MKRTAMNRGSGFYRKPYERSPRILYVIERLCSPWKQKEIVSAPKGPAADPGKGCATKAERAWMAAIVAHGCLACDLDGYHGTPAEVHHILTGGQRMGHLWTLPLCPGHHRLDDGSGKIARHPWKERFVARYGEELALLQLMRERLGVVGLARSAPEQLELSHEGEPHT